MDSLRDTLSSAKCDKHDMALFHIHAVFIKNGIHHPMHPVKTPFTSFGCRKTSVYAVGRLTYPGQRRRHRSTYMPSYTFTQRSKNSVSCTRPRASSAAATMPIHSFTYSRVQPCFSQYLAMYFSASSFSPFRSRRK